MKIAFYPSSCVPFHGLSLDERPLGGTETGVIRLSEAIANLGAEVVVFTGVDNPPLTKSLFLPFRTFRDLGPVDIFVSIRDWNPLLLPISTKLRFLWTGDSFDQIQNVGIGDRRVSGVIDQLLTVSDWHAETLCEHSGFPRDKAWPIRNGVHLPYFTGTETRKRKRLIYSSTPFRGLALIPQIYAELKKRHPDLELHVYSGYSVYKGPAGYSESAEADFRALSQELQSLPDVTVHGNIRQQELAREFMRSAILLYPNTFAETSCITAMEAQAAGCVTISSALGALPETVGDAGILIPDLPGSPAYIKAFIDATDRLLTDDALFNDLSETALKRSERLGWETVASRFMDFLANKYGVG